jgi:hypothetical protein
LDGHLSGESMTEEDSLEQQPDKEVAPLGAA